MGVVIGINGFGRIGRCTFKQLLADPRFEVVGINDLSDTGDLAYLVKHDSVHGWYSRKVSNDSSTILVDNHKVRFSSERSPRRDPVVGSRCDGGDREHRSVSEPGRGFESPGGWRLQSGHLRPSDDTDATFVYGINHHLYDPDRRHVVSNASRTPNCLGAARPR